MAKLKFILTILLLTFQTTLLAQNYEKPSETLPVELLYFVGDVVDTAVELRWGTATEINNYGYNILRADTSFDWEIIDFVEGHGNSYSPKDYVFYDTTITANGDYFYLLKQIDFDGNFELTHDTVKITVDYITFAEDNIMTIENRPWIFKLFQNYPNPFNPETNISFTVSEQNYVTLKLFSVTGEELETIYSGTVISGTHLIKYRPNNLSSGTYIYKLNIGNSSVSKKMLFIK